MTWYEYRFVSTIQDLLDAEAADRSRRLRAPFRWMLLLLGGIWVAAGIFNTARGGLVGRLVPLLLGCSVIYNVGLQAFRRRQRIKADSASYEIALDFKEEAIDVTVGGVGQFVRQWQELKQAVEARKGVLLYFTDGTVNWLPNRVFRALEERAMLLKFIAGRTAAGP